MRTGTRFWGNIGSVRAKTGHPDRVPKRGFSLPYQVPKKQRDYKAEYRRRIELGKRRGFTTAQSRGHAPKSKLSVKDTLLATSRTNKNNFWARAVYESQDPELIELYNKAKRDGWKKGSDSHNRLRDAVNDYMAENEPDFDPGDRDKSPIA